MKGLLSVKRTRYETHKLSEDLEWFTVQSGGLVKGGTYLLGGQPGNGKSTLGIQIAADIAQANKKVLYILTEQGESEFAARAINVIKSIKPEAGNLILGNINACDSVPSIDALPDLFIRKILPKEGKYHETQLVVLDSVQGQGLAANATKKYEKLYEFGRQCQSMGITLILISHVTKKGELAGPKTLEHNVSCVMVLKKSMSYRSLYVVKNRYGREMLSPKPLIMDKKKGYLYPAKLSSVKTSIAKGLIPGEDQFLEIQASVSLPSYGNSGRVTAPGLPRDEVRQILYILSQIPNIELGDLDYRIQCRLPKSRKYKTNGSLALAMAIISSYLQKPIPPKNIYIGEIGLNMRLEKLEDADVEAMIERTEELGTHKFYLPEIGNKISGINVMPSGSLMDVIKATWPGLAIE